MVHRILQQNVQFDMVRNLLERHSFLLRYCISCRKLIPHGMEHRKTSNILRSTFEKQQAVINIKTLKLAISIKIRCSARLPDV